MVSITKGEGFGRPLLEFTMTGKPVIASNWSGHKDFLPMDKAIMIGGKLTDVDDSAIDDFIIKGSKWFTANYNELIEVLKLVKKDYDTFLPKSEVLRIENKENFSMEKMIDKFKSLIPLEVKEEPIQKQLNLPKLNKIK
jgi:glycosyltransferase involved in cell wall biosynthesis